MVAYFVNVSNMHVKTPGVFLAADAQESLVTRGAWPLLQSKTSPGEQN